MSDQTTQPAEAEPTAAVDSPTEGIDQQQAQQAPQTDWERDYKELQREFTRVKQQTQDPEYQTKVAQEWLSANGYALPNEEPEFDELADPTDALRAELDEIKQQLASRSEEEQRAQQLQQLEEFSERKLSELGLAEKDPARDWIVSRAIAMNPTADGQLDIEGAHQQLQELQTHLQRQWRDTKRAPHMPAGGQAGTDTKNTADMSIDELTKWARQQYAEISQD